MDDVYIKNAVIMNALSIPIRLQILDMLSCGELCASAIQECFSISQPTLSYHMKILASAGVVSVRKEGKFIYYSLDSERIKVFFQEIEAMAAKKKDCICREAFQKACKGSE